MSTWKIAGAVVVVVAVAALAIGRLTTGATHVEQFTIVNPTRFEVTVAVSPEAQGGRLGLGTVGPGETKAFLEVADQGARWRVQFSSAGVGAGDVAVSRADLARDGWKLTVPADVDRRLEAAGLVPSEVR